MATKYIDLDGLRTFKEEYVDSEFATNNSVVKYNVAQSLTDNEKVVALNNLYSKSYDSSNNSGLGKVYLDKNNGILTQEMMNTANTVYVIMYDFTMSQNITIGENCTLEFDGGSINGGTISSNDSIRIKGNVSGNAKYNARLTREDGISNVSSDLKYTVLGGNLDSKLVSIDDDSVIYKVERYSEIKNLTISNSASTTELKHGIAFSTKNTNNPNTCKFNFLEINNFKTGIELYGNGYHLLNKVRINYCDKAITMDSTNWIGGITIENCHINLNKIGLEINAPDASPIYIRNCIFEGNLNDLILSGEVYIDSCYFGDHYRYFSQLNRNDDAGYNMITVKPGSRVFINNCDLNFGPTEKITSGDSIAFNLLGTDENPCEIYVTGGYINTGGQYKSNSYLFKSVSSKNILRFSETKVKYSNPNINFQHSWNICTPYNNIPAICPTANAGYNYVIDGYFKDDTINQKRAETENVTLNTNNYNIYGGKTFTFNKYFFTVDYAIPSSLVGKAMWLEVCVMKYDNIASPRIYFDDSDCEETGYSTLTWYNDKPAVNKCMFTPNKTKGQIKLFCNDISNDSAPASMEIGYIRLVQLHNKEKIDFLPSIDMILGSSAESIETLSNAIENKVDKVQGKVLSSNDYTNIDRAKVYSAITEHLDISGKANISDVYTKSLVYTKTETNSAISSGVSLELSRAIAAESELRSLYTTLTRNEIIPVESSNWPLPDLLQNVIYRVAGANSYTDYMYNGTNTISMATYNNSIDISPKEDSTNLITSGAVANFVGRPNICLEIEKETLYRGTIGTIVLKAGNTYKATVSRNTAERYNTLYICSGDPDNTGTIYMNLNLNNTGDGLTKTKYFTNTGTEDINANIVVSGTYATGYWTGLHLVIEVSNNNLLWTEKQSLTSEQKQNVLKNLDIDIESVLIPILQYEDKNYFVDNTTWRAGNGNYKSKIIPITGGGTIKCVANENESTRVAFLNSFDESYIISNMPVQINGIGNSNTLVKETKTYYIPDNCTHIVLNSLYNGVNSLPESFIINGKEYMKPISGAITDVNKSIIDQNNNVVITRNSYKESAIRSVGKKLINTDLKPFGFMHISDLHTKLDGIVCLRNAKKIMDHYDNLKCCIITGDIVYDTFADLMTYYDNVIKDTDKVFLNVIGNHDVGQPNVNVGLLNSVGNDIQVYNKFIKPYEQKWQLSGVNTENVVSYTKTDFINTNFAVSNGIWTSSSQYGVAVLELPEACKWCKMTCISTNEKTYIRTSPVYPVIGKKVEGKLLCEGSGTLTATIPQDANYLIVSVQYNDSDRRPNSISIDKNLPNGKNYYYKDFTEEKIRLIALYDFETDFELNDNETALKYEREACTVRQDLVSWLINTLLNTPNDYGVIVTHHVNYAYGDDNNAFVTPRLNNRRDSLYMYSSDGHWLDKILDAFQRHTSINLTWLQTGGVVTTLNAQADFSNSTAEFICIVAGHTHDDYIGHVGDYPNLPLLVIGADNLHYTGTSCPRINDDVTEDLINIVNVDRNRKTITVIRVGSDFSVIGQKRDYITLNYGDTE